MTVEFRSAVAVTAAPAPGVSVSLTALNRAACPCRPA